MSIASRDFWRRKEQLMGIIFLLIGASTVVAVIFLAGFVWAMRTGQYDDDRSPAVRILEPTMNKGANGERSRANGMNDRGEWGTMEGSQRSRGYHSPVTRDHSPATNGLEPTVTANDLTPHRKKSA